MEERNYSKSIYYILFFIAVVLIGVLSKILSSVILPVIFSILLALTFYPIVSKLNQKLKLNWILGSILVVILFIVTFFSLSGLLVKSFSAIINEYPKYENRFMAIYKLAAEQFNLEFDAEKSFITNMWNILEVRKYVQKGALFLSSGIVSFGKALLLVALLLTFLLTEMKGIKERFINSLDNSVQDQYLHIAKLIVNDVTRFLSIKFFISLATGLLVFLLCLILRLDFPIVWAFIAFIANFIPTFGSIFSTLITSIFALLQFYPSIPKVIIIFIFMLAINFTLGNIVEPKIEGNTLGLSTFAILVCLTFWGFIWGFVGMILAVPMTVIMKIVCENIPFLNPIAALLGKPRS